MPKRSKKGKRRNNKGGSSSSTMGSGNETYAFQGSQTYTLVGGEVNFAIEPTAAGINLPRLTTLTDPFLRYRFRELTFQLMCDTASTMADTAACIVAKDVLNTAVGSILQASETGVCSYVSTKQTVHGQKVKVPRDVLCGLETWYQTQGGGAGIDQEEIAQCECYIFQAAGTPAIRIWWWGVIECAGPVDPANSPIPEALYSRELENLKRRYQLYLTNLKAKDDVTRGQLQRLYPQLAILGPPPPAVPKKPLASTPGEFPGISLVL
jgi:hypothetical protein